MAHLCFFMPNQAQQQAAPPSVIDWEVQERWGEEEMKREEIVLAVIRRYLAVTALVSLSS